MRQMKTEVTAMILRRLLNYDHHMKVVVVEGHTHPLICIMWADGPELQNVKKTVLKYIKEINAGQYTNGIRAHFGRDRIRLTRGKGAEYHDLIEMDYDAYKYQPIESGCGSILIDLECYWGGGNVSVH